MLIQNKYKLLEIILFRVVSRVSKFQRYAHHFSKLNHLGGWSVTEVRRE